MDITLFTFFVSVAFLCMFFAWLFKRSGLGAGLGVISMMIFLMMGFLIGGDEEEITKTVVIPHGTGVGNITQESLDIGLERSDISIIFFALAIIALFAGT